MSERVSSPLRRLELEPDEIHAAVQQPPVVGQLVLDISRQGAPGTDLVEVETFDALHELGIEHLIDSAA
jgi:hypothetical protein